jgi:hypothetical protein
MNDTDRIKSLVKEADFYRSQGLLGPAREKYIEALAIVKNSEAMKKQPSLIDALNKRIGLVDHTIDEIDKATETPELSGDIQDLISRLFSYSKDKEIAAMEGAIALTRFGQYEKAVMEFQRMINEKILPLMAAENMLKCQLLFISPEKAIEQYKSLISGPVFNGNESASLQTFMENILKKEGIKADLPSIRQSFPEKEKNEQQPEPMLEISSVAITLKGPSGKETGTELDITFQTGNILSFIIKAERKDLIDSLPMGIKIPAVQCFSSLSIFEAQGVITGKKMIPSGPRQGDYSFDMTVERN